MKLNQLIARYVAFRKSLGAKFEGNETVLHTFARVVGEGRILSARLRALCTLARVVAQRFIEHNLNSAEYVPAFRNARFRVLRSSGPFSGLGLDSLSW